MVAAYWANKIRVHFRVSMITFYKAFSVKKGEKITITTDDKQHVIIIKDILQ